MKRELRMGGGSRKCKKCGEVTFGSKVHRCKRKFKELTEEELKLLNKPGTHTNYFATDL